MKEFASMVKISDKVLLWEHVVREDNNLDGNLAPDQKRLRENFYINCYRDEIIDPNQSKKREIMTAAEREAAEDAEISQIILEETGRKSISKKSVSSSMPRRYENYKDFFSTNQFVMDLSSITTWLFTAGKPVDIEEIIQRVRLSLRSHMENHLGKLTDAHMQGFVAAWKRKLTDLVEDFINRLVMANNLIERIEAERTIAPRNRLEDEIMHVIATFAPLAQPVPFISEQDIERAHLGISVARQGLFSASLPNHPAGHAQVRLGPPSNPVGHSEVWPSDNVDQNSETLIPGMNITQTL
jgi:hypothetical protein